MSSVCLPEPSIDGRQTVASVLSSSAVAGAVAVLVTAGVTLFCQSGGLDTLRRSRPPPSVSPNAFICIILQWMLRSVYLDVGQFSAATAAAAAAALYIAPNWSAVKRRRVNGAFVVAVRRLWSHNGRRGSGSLRSLERDGGGGGGARSPPQFTRRSARCGPVARCPPRSCTAPPQHCGIPSGPRTYLAERSRRRLR